MMMMFVLVEDSDELTMYMYRKCILMVVGKTIDQEVLVTQQFQKSVELLSTFPP